jgi:hypothetical protein
MIEAEIAKTLVQKDPELLLPENRDRLWNQIKLIYERDYTVTIERDAKEIAIARLAVAWDDELPQA